MHFSTPRSSLSFMQGQPHLVALGNSRIKLFKTFCLPTMVHQTTNDFLWVILIDPELNDALLFQIKELVAPYPHFYLYKQVAQEIDLHDINVSLVESGDVALLQQAAYESKHKIMVQTRLDADDGLAFELLEQVQTTALATLQHNNTTRPKGWMISCIKKHFEWHYELNESNTTRNDETGWLRLSITPAFCVTPGLSLAVAPGAKSWGDNNDESPIYPHDRITHNYPRCGGDNHLSTACFHTLNELGDPAAVRSRTPASSFMRGVGTTVKTKKTPKHHWAILTQQFGITQPTLSQTRSYLIDNVEAIAKENLESQWYVVMMVVVFCVLGYCCFGSCLVVISAHTTFPFAITARE